MVTIKLSNKLYYSLITIAIILLISAGVYAVQTVAPGTSANPGHNIADVGPPAGCSSGQYLQYIAGSGGYEWRCTTITAGTNYWTDSGSFVEPTSGDAVGATQYCDENGANCFESSEVVSGIQMVSNTAYSSIVSASCPSGKIIISGGCNTADQNSAMEVSYPSSNNWNCRFQSSDSLVYAYAICADTN